MSKLTKPPVLDVTGKSIVYELGQIAKNIAEQGTSFYYEIRVEIETGSTCIAQIGTKTVTAVSVNGIATLELDQIGTWTITGTTPEAKAMLPEVVTVTDHGIKYVVARFKGIYGVKWNATSSTSLTRTDDSVNLESTPVSYVAGMSEGEYGSPFDAIAPWSNIVVVDDEVCGKMVRIPKFWYKMDIASDNSLTLKIAEYAEEGYKVSPAHMDRGDGRGEREFIYVGRYHCGTNYKSVSGVTPMNNKTKSAFRSGIHSLGSDVWQMDYATRITIWLLYLVEYANFDTQNTIGYGCGNNSGVQAMGYTDSMPYHTGTTQTSKTVYGLGTQYRYMEGLWDNVLDWCDGIYFNDTEVYGILDPSKFSDTANGTLICTRPAASNYISAWQKGEGDYDFFIYPKALSGGEHGYVGDYCSYASSGVVLFVGGSYYQDQLRGLFYLVGNYGASVQSGHIGSRLLKLPS